VQRAAVNREPALTRSELIADLAVNNPPLRAADAELIVTTIFDQITDAQVSVKEKALPFFKAGGELRSRRNRDGPKRRT
jgi:integration host factor subunit beta